MEQEIITQLIKELFDSVDEMHSEYFEDGTLYTLDAHKEDNVLNITISLENKDKEEFEKFVDELDDDIYEEVIDSLKMEIKDLTDIYETEDYKDVIASFKNKVREVAQNKINYLRTLI